MTTILNSGSNLHVSLNRQQTMADLNRRLEIANQELSTGFKSDLYADLRTRSAESLSLRASMDRNENFVTSNKMLNDRMSATAGALKSIRGAAQEFLDLAVSNRVMASSTVSEMQTAARASLELLTGQANTAFQGTSLFSGVDSEAEPINPWGDINGTTSPKALMASIVGTGISSTADAQAKIAAVNAVFDDTAAAGSRFEDVFFNGTPRLDANGQPSPRVTALIDENVALEYGVQANDTAFRDLLKGLAMILSADPAQISDKGAYETWVKTAVDSVSSGIDGLLDTETRIGTQQNVVTQAMTTQDARVNLYRSKVLDLEGVDPYEASTRVMQLQTQLQATYEISSRMAKLSFLNFL